MRGRDQPRTTHSAVGGGFGRAKRRLRWSLKTWCIMEWCIVIGRIIGGCGTLTAAAASDTRCRAVAQCGFTAPPA